MQLSGPQQTEHPRNFEKGEEGEELWVWLRLKLIADIGIVGLPNAGKSTLLSSITRAKPKIADYPFTTLTPQMGVVRNREKEFVIADIPGLIEGAHSGVGLGTRFLGHIERCSVLLHLIDGTSNDILESYFTIRNELIHYGYQLDKKIEIIVISKLDIIDKSELETKINNLFKETDIKPIAISSITGDGCKELIDKIHQTLIVTKKAKINENEKTNESYN